MLLFASLKKKCCYICSYDGLTIPQNFVQVHESIDKSYLVSPQPQPSLQQISSQFHKALRLSPLEQSSEKVCHYQ